jgi:lincosamide nucleotidyltransferase
VKDANQVDYADIVNSNPSLQVIQETISLLAEAAQSATNTIALVGAGSAGVELSRMDQYSDIDFFLIVEDGCSANFIDENTWFEKYLPVNFWFRDTAHGNKALLANGVFLEFAVFTEAELAQYGIPGLRVIWSKEGFKLPEIPTIQPEERELSYYVDQALSNLYVGALRLRRGERLAALSMIERSALTNLLTAYRIKNKLVIQDPFNIERRAEGNFDVDFGKLIRGYDLLEKSLVGILAFAEENFEVNTSIVQATRNLLIS